MLPIALLFRFRYLILIVSVVVALGGVYWYIKKQGYLECQNEIIYKEVELHDKRAELEQEIITLPKPDLVRRYCKWMREGTEADCLQANLPPSE